jgi:hypothetical protein
MWTTPLRLSIDLGFRATSSSRFRASCAFDQQTYGNPNHTFIVVSMSINYLFNKVKY